MSFFTQPISSLIPHICADQVSVKFGARLRVDRLTLRPADGNGKTYTLIPNHPDNIERLRISVPDLDLKETPLSSESTTGTLDRNRDYLIDFGAGPHHMVRLNESGKVAGVGKGVLDSALHYGPLTYTSAN